MTESSSNKHGSFYSFSQVGPILFLALIFFLTFVARVILSPLMPEIESELGISHSRAGSMFFILSLGYFIALMGSGFLSARITHKHTIFLSAAIVGVALLTISASREEPAMLTAVFFLGMASGLYLPSGITTLTDMVEPGNWGKAVSIHEIAPNLGFVAAPVIAELLMLWYSWRFVLGATGTASICIGLVFAFFGKWGRFPGKPPGLESAGKVLSSKSFWAAVLLFGLAISSTMGIYTMLPLYLVNDIGIERSLANTIISVSRLSGLATALLSGWATDRFGARRTIRFALASTGITTILLGAASSPAAAVIIVFIQALAATVFFPAGFTALSSIFPADIRNLAVSFTIPFAFVFGGGVVPAFIGSLGDMNAFSYGFTAAGALISAGSLLPAYLKYQAGTEENQGGK